MKFILRSLVLMTAVAIVCAAIPATAQEATGGLRYTVTVTKFENRSGWHGYWDLGDAWDTVLNRQWLTEKGLIDEDDLPV